MNPLLLLPSALNALVLGILREASGSLLPPLFLHTLSGLDTVGAAYGSYGIGGFDDTAVAHTHLGWLILAALFTGIGLGMCRAVRAGLARAAESEGADPMG